MGTKNDRLLNYNEKNPNNRTRHVLDACVAPFMSRGLGQHYSIWGSTVRGIVMPVILLGT